LPKIKVHNYKTSFGWENDNGIGEMLIQQILKGEKTATCAPKEEYSDEELIETYKTVGEIVTVYDKNDIPRCNIKIKEVYETTFGNPDLKLVRGEVAGGSISKFQDDHRFMDRSRY
jgi:uncharacterized protein YhfF